MLKVFFEKFFTSWLLFFLGVGIFLYLRFVDDTSMIFWGMAILFTWVPVIGKLIKLKDRKTIFLIIIGGIVLLIPLFLKGLDF
jgi:hypothetical protein